MRTIRRLAVAAIATPAVLILAAGPGTAHECLNASKKNQAAGVQLVLNDQDQIVWVSNGLQGRIDRGLVDPATGEGFSGLIGFDVDGDGAADFATFIVGPDDEIPLQAQMNGATCKGIINIGTWFEECMPSAAPVKPPTASTQVRRCAWRSHGCPKPTSRQPTRRAWGLPCDGFAARMVVSRFPREGIRSMVKRVLSSVFAVSGAASGEERWTSSSSD